MTTADHERDRAPDRGKLLALASYLDGIPPERFDIQVLAHGTAHRDGTRLRCGCAIGWAAVCWPNDFVLRPRAGDYRDALEVRLTSLPRGADGVADLDAMTRFLAITIGEAQTVFLAASYRPYAARAAELPGWTQATMRAEPEPITARLVAGRLRDFVAAVAPRGSDATG